MLDLLEHLRDSHAKLHVKTLNVDLMLTANPKATKPFVFAKKVGLSFLRTFLKVALISTNAMLLTALQACVESMRNAPIETAVLTAPVHQAFPVTPINSASTSTSVQDKMLVVRMQFARTLRDPTLASVQKEQSPTLTQQFVAFQSFRAIKAVIVQAMPSVTLTNAAYVQNRTSATTVVIRANTSTVVPTHSVDWSADKPSASVPMDSKISQVLVSILTNVLTNPVGLEQYVTICQEDSHVSALAAVLAMLILKDVTKLKN